MQHVHALTRCSMQVAQTETEPVLNLWVTCRGSIGNTHTRCINVQNYITDLPHMGKRASDAWPTDVL